METRELEIATLKDCTFKVKPSHDSVFKEFEGRTDLPYIHLVIVDSTEKLKWPDIYSCGVGNGELIDICEKKMSDIIKFYFGDNARVEDFAWRYVLNSANAVSIETVHIHLYLAHKDLFGKDGLIMRTVDSIFKDDA
jgi:hypothetical protein